jgi:hypothetical protein
VDDVDALFAAELYSFVYGLLGKCFARTVKNNSRNGAEYESQ